ETSEPTGLEPEKLIARLRNKTARSLRVHEVNQGLPVVANLIDSCAPMRTNAQHICCELLRNANSDQKASVAVDSSSREHSHPDLPGPVQKEDWGTAEDIRALHARLLPERWRDQDTAPAILQFRRGCKV